MAGIFSAINSASASPDIKIELTDSNGPEIAASIFNQFLSVSAEALL